MDKTKTLEIFTKHAFLKISAIPSSRFLMPFPAVNTTPVESEYAAVENHATADGLLRAMNGLSTRFKVVDRAPVKAAATIYLGLCRLKNFTESGRREEGSALCYDILGKVSPSSSKGVSLNCSYFSGERKNGNVDHGAAIARACGVYIPRIKSRKKRCLMLLALGAQHDDHMTVPPNDDWVKDFNFMQI